MRHPCCGGAEELDLAPPASNPESDQPRSTLFDRADRLAFAASPTFAVMALLTSVMDGDAAMLCAGTTSPLTGMVTMYLLMSAFHAGPWVRMMRRARG